MKFKITTKLSLGHVNSLISKEPNELSTYFYAV